jgi:2-aminoadipate transaminase
VHRARVDPVRGTDVDAIEAVLRGGVRPAFLYLIPEGHNPLGTTISLADRRRIVELARRFEVPIVEDSPYGFLQHEGDVPAPLYALDPDNVIHIGSFSKILGPALRTGWMVVPPSLRHAFSCIKDAVDTDSSPFVARVIARVLEDERFVSQHLERLGRSFRERKLRLLAGLERALPHCTWTTPTCGLFVWLRLPDGIQPKALLELAIERERLAFLPGSMFGEGVAAQHGIRLSYGTAPLDQLEEGARRLGRLLTSYGKDDAARE